MAKVSTDVPAVVERLLSIVTACGMPFEELIRLQDAIRVTVSLAGCHSTDSLQDTFEGQQSFDTACTFVDTFAIVHVFLHRVDRYARPTRFATSLTLCPARKSFILLSLCGVILKYATITNLFLRYHYHRASGGLNKSWRITAK